jgi:CRISPR-associated endonuclease Cas2
MKLRKDEEARRVAKACRDFCQHVQFSVFEIEVDPARWTKLKAMLVKLESGQAQFLGGPRSYH